MVQSISGVTVQRGLKHHDSKFSIVPSFSLDILGTDGGNSLLCKTTVGGNIGLGVLILTVWEHLNAFARLSCTRQRLLEKAAAAWLGLWNEAFNALIAY